MANREIANILMNNADDDEIATIIDAINTTHGRVNCASIVIACAQTLAQHITAAGKLAPHMRRGIMTLIDDYATRVATEEPPT